MIIGKIENSIMGCEGNPNVLTVGTMCRGIFTERKAGILKENESIRISGYCKLYNRCEHSLRNKIEKRNWALSKPIITRKTQ